MINPHSASGRLRQSTARTVGRILYKHTLGRLLYAAGDSYKAEAYWTDRFTKFGNSLRGPGHEGLSEADNALMYEEAGRVFREFCAREQVSFAGTSVLEIGCGTGFYTDQIARLGPPAAFTGLDITDVNFEALRARHPKGRFVKADVTKPSSLNGTFDVIVMIDVIHHVVANREFDTVMANVRRWLAPGGVFIIAPFAERAAKPFFYVRWWTLDELLARFEGFRIGGPVSFRDNKLVALHAPQAGGAPGAAGPSSMDAER